MNHFPIQQKYVYPYTHTRIYPFLFIYTKCIPVTFKIRTDSIIFNLTLKFLVMDSNSKSKFRIHFFTSFRSYQYLADQHKAFKRTVRPDLGLPESDHCIALHCKKTFRYSRPQPGFHLPNHPRAGIRTSYIIIPAQGEFSK
jgi:hypothetical protein